MSASLSYCIVFCPVIYNIQVMIILQTLVFVTMKVMREEWENYLLSKVELQALPKQSKKKPKQQKQPKGFGVLDGVVLAASGQKAEISSACKQEHDALLAAASEISKKAKKDAVIEETLPNSMDGGGCGSGKGKGKKRKKKAETSKSDCDSATINISHRVCSSTNEEQMNGSCPALAGSSAGNAVNDSSLNESLLQKEEKTFDAETSTKTKQLPPMHFYALESNQHILDILKPSVIIVYHPEIAFVREIEVYKAENPSIKVKVFFLFYEDSTEVQKFEASVRRENGAFESLIRQKSLMMIPVDQVCF